MIGKALDSNHDIYALNGRIAVVTGADEIAQHIKTRLLLFFNEWFLDIEAGTPWFESILSKPADMHEIEPILKKRILQTPGVDELIEFDMNYTAQNRRFSVDFRVTTDLGDVANSVQLEI